MKYNHENCRFRCRIRARVVLDPRCFLFCSSPALLVCLRTLCRPGTDLLNTSDSEVCVIVLFVVAFGALAESALADSGADFLYFIFQLLL